MTLDSALLHRTLHTPGGLSQRGGCGWLLESYANPSTFFAALAASAPMPAPRKSDLDGGIDPVSDWVEPRAQHRLGDAHAALVFHDSLSGWQTLTYASLHLQAITMAQHLRSQGCAESDQLALLLPLGPSLLVGFVAALRLGMQVSFVPPEAPYSLVTQLQVLRPRWIFTEPRYHRLLPDPRLRAAILPAAPERPRPLAFLEPHQRHSSHTYAADAPLFQLCSPLHADSPTPIAISAGSAYASALRDALLLGLLDGASDVSGSAVRLMAPAAHLTQHVPSLLCATLAAGATLVEAPWPIMQRDPTVLQRGAVPVHHLLLPTDFEAVDLHDLLDLAEQGAIPALRRLFFCPILTRSTEGVRALKPRLAEDRLSRIPASHLLLDASVGGAVLFSEAQLGGLPSEVFLAPGCAHRLEDPNRPGQPTGQRSGRLRLQEKPPSADGELLLARLHAGYYLAGSQTLRRQGRVFPRNLLFAYLRKHGRWHDYSIVQRAAAKGAWVELLLFGGSVEQPPAFPEHPVGVAPNTEDPTATVATQIRLELGPHAVPDTAALLPIFPRMRGAEVDHRFYQSGDDAGLLQRLVGEPVFQEISTLRGLVRRMREVT